MQYRLRNEDSEVIDKIIKFLKVVCQKNQLHTPESIQRTLIVQNIIKTVPKIDSYRYFTISFFTWRMTNKLLKSGYLEKQVGVQIMVSFQSTFRKKWARRFLELRENELKWYVDEGDVCDGYISLKDIASIEDCEYSVEKPQCLMITLVSVLRGIPNIQTNKKVHWFAFETVLELKSWKAAIEDAKTLYFQNESGSTNSPISGEIAVCRTLSFDVAG